MANYDDDARATKDKLNSISPSMCMAKWLQVSLHLPQGRTHSCYHPPTHRIPLSELSANPNALHNTKFKLEERKQMKQGKRPEGCQYCWNVEDAPKAPPEGRLSDRHYRSSEWWVKDAWNEVVENDWDHDIAPRYVEVNFNQACNFKCMYCSPHLSTTWEEDVKKHGPFNFSVGEFKSHNEIASLETMELMPLKLSQKENPYVTAFWEWFPNIYKDLKVFRMTGGEPLMDKNTFKIFDYIKQNPNPNLEISLTTNLCPPTDDLFDKFLDKIKELDEPVIPENDMSKTVLDLDWYKHNIKENYKRIIFYVEDPKDGSSWKTWKQQIVKESLQTTEFAFEHKIVDKITTINFEDIKQTFTGIGPCDDEYDNSFLYVSEYIFNKEHKIWEHQFNNVYAKHISIFVSLDGVGSQAEYMRNGLNFEKLKNNIDRLLSSTKRVSVSFINTFNLLSIDSLDQYLQYILELRNKYDYAYQENNDYSKKAQRIWFDIPYLRYPPWMTIQLADNRMLDKISDTIEFMKQNVLTDKEYGKTFHGFKNYEVLKLERNLAWAQTGRDEISEQDYTERMIQFVEYFTEYDRRCNTNFLETFPEMTDFWEIANEF